ncbi:MAG: hypothetical protein ACHQSE_13015 [Gemmatimonadales bacterium]
MTEQAQFDAAEQARMRECFARGEPVVCPRCSVVMTARAIGGGSFGLGYARKREWLICPKCRRSALFDVKRGTRN